MTAEEGRRYLKEFHLTDDLLIVHNKATQKVVVDFARAARDSTHLVEESQLVHGSVFAHFS